MKDFTTALALVFVIEGVLYSLFPDGMKRLVAQVMVLPASAPSSVSARYGLSVMASCGDRRLSLTAFPGTLAGPSRLMPGRPAGSGWFKGAISRKIAVHTASPV
jgi:uncharacterized protein YjeT (DUF2065 family)